MSNFHQLEVVSRGYETQLQVGENWNSTFKDPVKSFQFRNVFKVKHVTMNCSVIYQSILVY